MEEVHIVLVGDYRPDVTAHQAIPKALALAGKALEKSVSHEWLDTVTLTGDMHRKLQSFGGVWVVPASPYENIQGVLAAIKYARETKTAFLGTCGGYQHAILEFARNVLGLEDADNAEINPDTTFPLIAPLTCSLVEKEGSIFLVEGSKATQFYGRSGITEAYRCSYGFNPAYTHLFSDSDLWITGADEDGEPRIIELKTHPFFIGTAFQPERSALKGKGHPLINAFVQNAVRVGV